MGIRESLNKNPTVAGAIATVLVLIAAVVLWQMNRGSGAVASQPQAYFTTDDGVTLINGDVNRVPPFDHEGKEAVRAYVFTCDGGTTKFVAWMEKYTPEARAKFEQMKPGQDVTDVMEHLPAGSRLLKKPGGPWVAENAPTAAAVRTPGCPNGTGTPLAVMASDRSAPRGG